MPYAAFSPNLTSLKQCSRFEEKYVKFKLTAGIAYRSSVTRFRTLSCWISSCYVTRAAPVLILLPAHRNIASGLHFRVPSIAAIAGTISKMSVYGIFLTLEI